MRYRKEEENVGRQAERLGKIEDEISQLQDSYNNSNKVSQMFNKKRHEKALAELNRERDLITRNMKDARQNEEFELRIAYGDAKTNPRLDLQGNTSDFRAQFFGHDDPDRAAKVERALELYSKYGDAWRDQDGVSESAETAERSGLTLNEQTAEQPEQASIEEDVELSEEEVRPQDEQEREDQDREDFERGKAEYEKIEAELVDDLRRCYQAKNIESNLSSQSRQVLSGLEGMVQQTMETSKTVGEFTLKVTQDEAVKARIRSLASRQK